MAEQLGRVLNEEATDGWEYVRAETLTTPGRSGMFQKNTPAAYVVLIFRKLRGGAEREPDLSSRAGEAASPSAAPAPIIPAASAAPVIAAPTDPVPPTFSTSSVQIVSNGDPASTVTPMRPLGSATE